MKISLWCTTHNSIVTQADNVPLFIASEAEMLPIVGSNEQHVVTTEWQLDDGNLYCTGGTGEHEFQIVMRTKVL